MRSYLLGGLMPERRSELEALAQSDDSVREELLALEEELVEQYLAGCLTVEENQSFETQILTTERGKQKLHFAELFGRYRSSHTTEVPMAEHSVPAPNFPPTRHSSPLFSTFYRNPTFAVLSIAVASLLILLAGWTMIGPSRGTSIAVQTLSGEVVVPLVPDSTRSAASINHLAAPAKNQHIKLELELTKSDFKKYRMQLFRDNQALDAQEELKTETRDSHYVIPVVVTSEILTPGDYQLKLCGVLDSGQPSFVDNYPFRVTGQEPNDPDLQRDQRDAR